MQSQSVDRIFSGTSTFADRLTAVLFVVYRENLFCTLLDLREPPLLHASPESVTRSALDFALNTNKPSNSVKLYSSILSGWTIYTGFAQEMLLHRITHVCSACIIMMVLHGSFRSNVWYACTCFDESQCMGHRTLGPIQKQFERHSMTKLWLPWYHSV